MHPIVADFRAEVAALDALLAPLPDQGWLAPTPAQGWDIRDTVTHLAMSNELALESVLTGASTLIETVLAAGSVEALEQQQLDRGRAMPPGHVHAWWLGTNEALATALDGVAGDARLPWGPNVMSLPSFVTARLMETWAHGLDCFAALDAAPVDTDRLRHVAHLGLRSLPYAFAVRGLPAPGGVRLSLTAPDGSTWDLGPDDGPTVITGAAGDWCRVAVHRDRGDERSRLTATGPDGPAVLDSVQAYLSA